MHVHLCLERASVNGFLELTTLAFVCRVLLEEAQEADEGCPDSMFGNVLSLDTILDKEALLHVTDERNRRTSLFGNHLLNFVFDASTVANRQSSVVR